MPTETRPRRGRDPKGRYSPLGAFVLALILHLVDFPKPTDAEERGDGQA